MRIAYICADPGVPVFGQKGSSIHVQSVIRALRAQGAQVELFATRWDGPPPADLADLICHRLPSAPKGELAQREQRLLEANQSLWLALLAAGRFDAIYERYSLWSYAGMEYARTQGIPGLLEVNAPLIDEQLAHRGLVNLRAAHMVAQRVFGAASQLLAVSQGVADYLHTFRGTRGRVLVVPNGVDLRRFPADLAPSWQSPGMAFTVGFVGTLKPWHGLDVLFDALRLLRRHVRDAQLLLVGDGPEREQLSVRAEQLGLDVHFTGAVAPDAVPGLIRSMDVAVAPYPERPDFYFSPLKLYEYMAAGRAVVASRIGQIEQLITHGENGLLCAPGDPTELAALLCGLQGAPLLRRRLGNAARSTMQQHSWDVVAEQILTYARPMPALRKLSSPARATALVNQ